MAAKPEGFVLEIDLIPSVIDRDNEVSDPDAQIVYDALKDVHMVNMHLHNLGFFHLVGVTKNEENQITLKCSIGSRDELKQLNDSVQDSLGKKLAEFAEQQGLLVELGFPASDEVLFDLDITKRQQKLAEKFFKEKKPNKGSSPNKNSKGKSSSPLAKATSASIEKTVKDSAGDPSAPDTIGPTQPGDYPISAPDTIGPTKPGDYPTSAPGTIGPTKPGDYPTSEPQDTIGPTKHGDYPTSVAPALLKTPQQSEPNHHIEGADENPSEWQTVQGKRKVILGSPQEQPSNPGIETSSALPSGWDQEMPRPMNPSLLGDPTKTEQKDWYEQTNMPNPSDPLQEPQSPEAVKTEDMSKTSCSQDVRRVEASQDITKAGFKHGQAITDVFLHVPPRKGSTVSYVGIYLFKKGSQVSMNSVHLKQQTDHIWTCQVFLPVSMRGFSFRFEVCFIAKGLIFSSQHIEHSGYYSGRNGSTLIYFMSINAVHLGVFDHVEAIMFKHGRQNLKQALMFIDEVMETYRKIGNFNQWKEMPSLFKDLVDKMMKNQVQRNDLVILAYVFGHMLKRESNFQKNHPMKKKTYLEILKSFQSLKRDDVPQASLTVFSTVIEHLIHQSFDDQECHILSLLEFCYPFLPGNILSDLIYKLLNNKIKENGVQPILQRIFGHFDLDEECSHDMLLTIMRHSDLKQWIKVTDECMKRLSGKELDEVIGMKVVKQCRLAEKDKTFTKLNELYEMVVQVYPSFTRIFGKSFLTILKTCDRKDEVNPEAFQTLLLTLDSEIHESAMEMIADSKNTTIHKYLVGILTSESCTEVPDIGRLALKWLDTGMKNIATQQLYPSPLNDLEDVYKLLETVMTIPLLAEDEKLTDPLKSKVFEFLRQIQARDLVSKCFTIRQMLQQSTAMSCFLEHVEEHLFIQQKAQLGAILSAISGEVKKDGCLFIETKLQAKILTLAVRYSRLEDTLDIKDAVSMMMQHSKFWKGTLCVKGPCHKDVDDQPMMTKAKSILTKFLGCLEEKRLSVSFLKQLKDKDKKGKGLCRLLSIVGQDDKKTQLSLDRCLEAMAYGEKDLEFLNIILKKIESLAERDNLQCAKRMLKERSEDFKEGRVDVERILSRQHWEPFKDALMVSERYTSVVRSEIFWDICEEVLPELEETQDEISLLDMDEMFAPTSEDEKITEEGRDQYEDEEVPNKDEKDPTEDVSNLFKFENTCNPESTLHIMKLLFQNGIDAYRDVWNPLFKGEDVFLGDVHYIINAENLVKEIKAAEKVFNQDLPEWVQKALEMNRDYNKYEKKFQVIKGVLSVFEENSMNDESFAGTVHAFETLRHRETYSLKLRVLYDTMKLLQDIEEIVTDDMLGVLEEIASSSNLLNFLKDVPTEDLRNLIDAVEEHSEQSVQESTVTALLDVKRFFDPLVVKIPNKAVLQQLKVLKASIDETKVQNLEVKLNDCNNNFHALKALFSSVANRGEMTRDVVKMMMTPGARFLFETVYSEYTVKFSYDIGRKQQTHNKEDLSDLRGRALLMVNTERQSKTTQSEMRDDHEAFERFIVNSDHALEIMNLLNSLHHLGHPEMNYLVRASLSVDMLKSHQTGLEEALASWQNALSSSREDYYWLNFFYPQQLKTIREYFEDGRNEKEALSLLSFTKCQNISFRSARDAFQNLGCVEDDVYGLKRIGQTLDIVLKRDLHARIPFDQEDQPSQSFRIADTVQPGKLFVASLDQNIGLTVPTVLTLYRNTTGTVPLPYQIFLCQEDTQWEDIDLFLKRCFRVQGSNDQELFVMISVEKLSNDVQFQLVEDLKCVESTTALLAVICRGTTNQPFMNHFAENIQHVQPLSESEMERYMQVLYPDVTVVTSDLPGQGKSERTEELACEENLDISTLHISGDVSPCDLIQKLTLVSLSPDHVLHLDIGLLDKPEEVELLLFQIVLLGNIYHKSNMWCLRTKYICIEIANTIDDVLRNSLQVLMYFRQEHLQWKNYTNLKVSQELCSSVQVVCNYLEVYDKAKTDSQDLFFTGVKRCSPLSHQRCQELLRKHFNHDGKMSFSLVEVFLNVLSDQLKKFSSSHFFQTVHVSDMLGDSCSDDVRTKVLEALLNMSKEFATRSVFACRENQKSNVESMRSSENLLFQGTARSATASSMTQRVGSMIQWTQSNHLIVAFHNEDTQTVTALYRSKDQVPVHIKKLFETQIRKEMPNFSQLSQKELQKILKQVARFKQEHISDESLESLSASYALTPDNLLKMILIILRIRAHVPVIIMGETGCGKTSLISYLSQICGVCFEVLNIHAGVSETDLVDFITKCNSEAVSNLEEFVWVFLDEINTCNHLGVINDIVCHHTVQGNPLAPNLVVIAACNPYRLRDKNSIFTAGLDSKVLADEQSKLVYRVNPLPESMIDFIWDYGSPTEDDEASYIERMVHDAFDKQEHVRCLLDLLVASQQFIRRKEKTESCVSLRDVNRCRILIVWFKEQIKIKPSGKVSKKRVTINEDVIAMILALAHTYHSRLPDTKTRKKYRNKLSEIFLKHDFDQTEENIDKTIHFQQRDLINRMELPEGIAKNVALQENVFVIMVSILNRIPIFVVGKPGCSKSLSLQLIKSNLRGPDSKDEYFKKLPSLYCVAFQGSESSTSDGIIKVFEKAERYRESTRATDVLPVVILDEIGLAETSRFNPLKVLHSHLEPSNGEMPKVAVVGISNWALDAAKMNRAVHLSRPDMDTNELFNTGLSISEAAVEEREDINSLAGPREGEKVILTEKELIKAIADAYFEYISGQRFKNFHGLRDFYSLIKYVAKQFQARKRENTKLQIVERGLLRNFGGLRAEMSSVITIFRTHLIGIDKEETESWRKPLVLDLVKDNIEDKSARHLLLVTRGESVLSLIEDQIKRMEKHSVTILGSQFEEDLREDYSYRILSKIILCMEQGVVLILKDLENIYGSLYDMLNQNYSKVGLKKTCRVAHGAYSNPVCHVHEDFRCIVLVEEKKLDLSDPPFLNRFEKQCIRLADVLSDEERKLEEEMEKWMKQIASIQGQQFNRSDLIPVHSPDMLASVIHWMSVKQDLDHLSHTEKLERFKKHVLKTCSPDAIFRLERCELYSENPSEVEQWKEYYFNLPIHEGLAAYIDYLETEENDDNVDMKQMIFTHSNVHCNIALCVNVPPELCQFEKLNSYKSEKHLSSRLQEFWSSQSREWLIIQCSPGTDQENILLMKSLVEKGFADYRSQEDQDLQKRVIVLVHMDRSKHDTCGFINFLSGWNLTVVDTLETKDANRKDICGKSKIQLANDMRQSRSLKRYLFWAFTVIKYQSCPRNLSSLRNLVKYIHSNEELHEFLENQIFDYLNQQVEKCPEKHWQIDVACDRLKLLSSSTLLEAFEREVNEWMKFPLAAVVFKVEAVSAWDSMQDAEPEKTVAWKHLASMDTIIDITDVPPLTGPETYPVTDPVLSLQFPFSKIFIERIEGVKEFFTEVLRSDHPGLEIEDIEEDIVSELCGKMQHKISMVASEMFELSYSEKQFGEYVEDFVQIMYFKTYSHLESSLKVKVLKWSLSKRLQRQMASSLLAEVTRLHVINWLHMKSIEAELRLVEVCLETTKVDIDDILGKECSSKIHPYHQLTDEVTKDAGIPEDLSTEEIEEEEGEVEQELFTGLHPQFLEKTEQVAQETIAKTVGEIAQTTDDDVVVECMADMERSELFEPQTSVNGKESDFEEVGVQTLNDTVVTRETDNHSDADIDETVHFDGGSGLVTFVCKKLIPSSLLMEMTSVGSWVKSVSLVLSLASYQLEMYAVESQELYSIIVETLNELHQRENVQPGPLRHFFACYLSICLAADPETTVVGMAFNALENLTIFADCLDNFGPTMCQILMMELEDVDVLDFGEWCDSPTLATIEDTLQKHYDQNEGDSDLACIVLDIVQSHMLPDPTLDDGAVAQLLLCHSEFTSDGSSLKHVSALAFLRHFLNHFASEIKTGTVPSTNVVQALSGIIHVSSNDKDTGKNSRTEALRGYFLKVLCQKEGLKSLQRLRCMEEIFSSDYLSSMKRSLSLETRPMELKWPDIYRRVLSGYNTLPGNTTELKKLFEVVKQNPEILYCIFGVALENIFLIRLNGLLSSTEREKAKSFFKMAKGKLLKHQEDLLKCLCTEDDFQTPILQVSTTTSAVDQQMAICLLHLTSSLLAYAADGNVNTWPMFSTLMKKPHEMSDVYIPGSIMSEKDLHYIMFAGEQSQLSECASNICPCGMKTVCIGSETTDVCEKCQTQFEYDWLPEEVSVMDKSSVSGKGTRYVNPDFLKNELLTTRRMSPATFRFLQFITHACVATSLGLGFTKDSDLAKMFNLPDSKDVQDYLSQQLHSHWKALTLLTEMGDVQLGKLLNFVIADTLPLLTMADKKFTTDKEQYSFETTLDTIMNKIMPNRFHVIQDAVKKFACEHPDSEAAAMDVKFAELADETDRNVNLPKLLRDSIPPSVENMERSFFLQQCSDRFPIMALLFEKKIQLSLLEHLLPIIQWHLNTLKHGSFNSKIAECNTVEQFLHSFQKNDITSDEVNELTKRFESFKKSWNKLLHHESLLQKYNPDVKKIERLHRGSQIDACIIKDRSSNVIQVLKALVAIQNEFLTDCVIVTLSKQNLSTCFLMGQSDKAATLPVSRVENASTKNVVSMPDLEEMLKFSQTRTEMGEGRLRQYDMYQIEVQVLAECLVNRTFLALDKTFPLMRFTGDVMQNTDELLREITEIVGHDKLEKELQKTIVDLKDSSLHRLHVLTDCLEMTFSLLKRAPVRTADRRQSLDEFLQTWQSFIPDSLRDIEYLCQRISLNQLVSMYELVEDIMTDVVYESLEEKYRAPIPSICQDHLTELLKSSDLEIQEALLAALRKIVVRHIKYSRLKITDSLSLILKDRALWSMAVYKKLYAKDVQQEEGLLHPELLVEHVHATSALVEDNISEQKKKNEKLRTLNIPVKSPEADATQTKRKKTARQFRKR